mgnify:CR=1 FL=1
MIKQAKFVVSVADASKVPDYGVPEIAIAGKSNVGKSSFINFMVNQNKLAKTSQEPGRTRLLNYFEINNGEYYFVDLPGYGYAKVNKKNKNGADLSKTICARANASSTCLCLSICATNRPTMTKC